VPVAIRTILLDYAPGREEMQGTVMMLMALSGLGCHNKGCDVVYAAPTYSGYSSGCYANVYPSYVSPQSYTGCYAGGYSGCYATIYDGGCFGGGCYGGGLSSCYAGCYGGGHHGCGLLARLFSHCGSRRHGCYGSGYDSYWPDSYGGDYGYDLPYSPSMYGYARPFDYGVGAPGEAAMGYQGGMTGTPSEAAPPVPATPAPSTPSTTTPVPDLSTPPPPPRPAVPGNVVPNPAVPGDVVPTPPKPST
jgi:hypothetical protein